MDILAHQVLDAFGSIGWTKDEKKHARRSGCRRKAGRSIPFRVLWCKTRSENRLAMERIWQLLYLSTSKSERQESWNKSDDLFPLILVQYLLADLLLCAWYLWKHRHGVFRNLPAWLPCLPLFLICNCKDEAGSQTLGLLVAASSTYTGGGLVSFFCFNQLCDLSRRSELVLLLFCNKLLKLWSSWHNYWSQLDCRLDEFVNHEVEKGEKVKDKHIK